MELSWQLRGIARRLRGLVQGNLQPVRRVGPAKEATMELRNRLNVLAAIISFAFLTAVVFGMF
jgi:hypothetical protein